MFLKGLFFGEDSVPSDSSGDGGENNNGTTPSLVLGPVGDGPFDKLPRDVLAMILCMCMQGETVSPLSIFGSSSAHLAAEREAVRAVNKQVQALALVSRCFARAAATEGVARRALEVAELHVPARVWYGGSLREAFKAQWALKLEQARHQAKQEEVLARPTPMVACGMRAPHFRNPPMVHPEETPKFAQFAGLNSDEGRRVQQRAEQLVGFLRSFACFAESFKADAALLRYRMFLKLRQDHPNALLLPTADILFAELAHVFRTAAYHEDVKNGVPMTQDPLQLSKSEEVLYNQAARGTAKLWQETYGEAYFAAIQAKEHEFFTHQEAISPFGGGWAEVPFQPPTSFVAAVGPSPRPSRTPLPSINLTAKDLINDLQWMPELERSFGEMYGQAFKKLDMPDHKQLTFIAHLLKGYQRFLFLCKTRPDLAHDLAPPVAIDLLWHAHQSTPRLYLEETTRIVGFRLDHDPWPTEKKELRPLSEEFQCAWKTAFGRTIEQDHSFVKGLEP